MEEQKKPATPRRGRPSTLPKNRVNFGLRISAELLNQVRDLADDAQIISLNSYIVTIIAQHVNHCATGRCIGKWTQEGTQQ